MKRASIWIFSLLLALAGGFWFGYHVRNPPVIGERIVLAASNGFVTYPKEAFRLVNHEVGDQIDAILGDASSRHLLVSIVPEVVGYRVRIAGDSNSKLWIEPNEERLCDWIAHRMDEIYQKEIQAEQDEKQDPKLTFLCTRYTIIGGHPLKGPLYRDKCFIYGKDGKLFMTRDFDGKSETAEMIRSQYDPEALYTWNVNFPKAKLQVSYIEGLYHDNFPILYGETTKFDAVGSSKSFGVETAYPDVYSIPGKPDAEQPGADQPATQPADKAPVKDQPLTPTSEVSPR